MINDDNQRNLNLNFYERRRYYNQSETTMMSVYQRGDSVSNQPLTLPLTVVYPLQQLITTPSFSGFYYAVPIFQYWCPNCCSDVSKYGNCKYTWQCTVTFINECFLLSFHVMMFNKQRHVRASIIIIHCINLNDQSLQRAFPIINNTKCILRKWIVC